jgi:hypothetical protein
MDGDGDPRKPLHGNCEAFDPLPCEQFFQESTGATAREDDCERLPTEFAHHASDVDAAASWIKLFGGRADLPCMDDTVSLTCEVDCGI